MKNSDNVVVLHVAKYTDHNDRLCNHDCLFCMERMEPNHSNKVLPSIKNIESALERFVKKNKKIEEIYIAGGEPTLRPDFSKIVKVVSKYCSNIILSTSCDYTTSIYEQIKNLGIKKIATSVHGDTSELHDFLTNKVGSFYRTIDSIRYFIELGCVVSVNTVICSFNILRLAEIIQLFKENSLNISKLTLTHYINHGNAFYHNELKFNIDNYADIITKAIDVAQNVNYQVSFRDFPLCLDSRLESLRENIENIQIINLGSRNFYYKEEQAPNFLKNKCIDCTHVKKCSHYLVANYLEE